MPTFFPDGRVLAGATGGGQDRASIDNVALSTLEGVLVSVPRPLDNDRIIYSTDAGMEILTLSTGATAPVRGPANWLEAGDGVWAARRQSDPPEYEDSLGNKGSLPWRPLAANRHGVLVSNYQSGAGAWLLLTDGADSQLIPPSVAVWPGDGALDGECWAVRLSQSVVRVGRLGHPAADVTVPWSVNLALAYPYLLMWGHAQGSLIVVNAETEDWASLTSGEAYLPAAQIAGGWIVAVAWARTLGERPGTIESRRIDLWSLHWHASDERPPTAPPPTAPPPTDPPPAPPETPQEPTTMQMHADVYATYLAVAAKFPHTGTEDERREATKKAVQTLRARHGDRWVCKTEHPTGWAAASKDAVAYVPTDPVVHGAMVGMFIWDMVNGTTRQPNPRGESEPLRSAFALVPEAFDWLADSRPVPGPDPGPGPEPGPAPGPSPTPPATDVLAALGRIEAKQDAILQRLEERPRLVLTLERPS